MQFFDFFCQGLGPFKSSYKAIFEGRSTAIYGASGSGKTTIFNGIIGALYDEHAGKIRSQFLNSSSSASRVALTFRIKEGIFRVIKDFTNGKVQLFKYSPEEKKFLQYTDDPEQVSLFLSGDIGLPDYKTFVHFFTLSSESVLNLFATKRSSSPTSPVSPQQLSENTDSSSQEERISLLKAELEKAEKIRKLEFELDGLEQKLFDLEDKKRNAEGLMEKVKDISDQIKKYEPLEHLPPDIEEKVKKYGKEQERVRLRVSNLEERLNELESERLAIESSVPWKDATFFMGVALFIGSIIGFFLVPPEGWLRYVKYAFPVITIGGLSILAYTLWRFLGGREKLRILKDEILKLQREKRKIENSFEVEYGIIPKLMQEFNLNFPEEILEFRERKKELEKELEEIKARTGGLAGEGDLTRVDEEMAEIRERINEIKGELEALGPLIAPEEELRKELETLEASGGGISGESLIMADEAASPRATSLQFEDLFFNAFHRDFSSFLFENVEMIGKFLKALTGGRWVALGYTDTLTLEKDGTSVPLSSASSSEKVAAAISILIALRIWAKERFPVPIIIDTPEVYLSAREKQLCGRFLSEFAKKFQLIVFYKLEDFPLNFDKRITLSA